MLFIWCCNNYKDVNTSNYQYSGYGICFDAEGSFTFGNRNDVTNIIIHGCHMSSFGNDSTGRNNIHVLGKSFIQRMSTDGDGHTINHKEIFKANMTKLDKKCVLSLHYNGDNSYLFVNYK